VRSPRRCSRNGCPRLAVATLTYVYADSTAVVGPLAAFAEPHSYDLCEQHARGLTAPRGWDLVRHEGEFFAVQNNCSHKDFPLSEAGFDPRDGFLVCAWHGGCFDLRTGDAVIPPATDPVETFPVRVTDGWVEIGLTGSLAPG